MSRMSAAVAPSEKALHVRWAIESATSRGTSGTPLPTAAMKRASFSAEDCDASALLAAAEPATDTGAEVGEASVDPAHALRMVAHSDPAKHAATAVLICASQQTLPLGPSSRGAGAYDGSSEVTLPSPR